MSCGISVERSDEEVDEVFGRCINWCHEGDGVPHFPGMTYEQGVMAVIDWLTNNGDAPDEP